MYKGKKQHSCVPIAYPETINVLYKGRISGWHCIKHMSECGFAGQVRARARFWFVWVKELGKFLDEISYPKCSVIPLLIFSRGSAPLEQCGSAAPFWKFRHSSQPQESDILFLKDFGKSSLEEGPPHCLLRGQGQTHESGLWFRDWNPNNLEEFVLGVLALAYCSYFLGFISYILMRYLSSINHNGSKSTWPSVMYLSLGQNPWGFATATRPYLCSMIARRQGPSFMGREMIITSTEREYVRDWN